MNCLFKICFFVFIVSCAIFGMFFDVGILKI